jgi:hypothetical protein
MRLTRSLCSAVPIASPAKTAATSTPMHVKTLTYPNTIATDDVRR